MNLAYVGSIKDEVMPKTDVAYALLKLLYKNYKEEIILKYKLTEEEQNSIITKDQTYDILKLMDMIALKRGAIVSGGEIDYEKVSNIEGIGKKSAENLKKSIESSKDAGLARLLFSLGIPNIGIKAAKALVNKYSDIELLFGASEDDITQIDDFGKIMAQSVVDYFSMPSTRELIDEMKKCGIRTYEENKENSGIKLAGKIFVITGTLPTLKRIIS